MAVLETLRNRAGLFVSIIIGLALLAFILGDIMKNANSLSRDEAMEVAEINGESVRIQEYQSLVEQLTENYKRNTNKSALDEQTLQQIRQQAWETLVMNYVMGKEYDELGITVTPEELMDMVQGQNIDPQIQQIPIFKNPQTGQFDKTLVIRFLKNLDADPTGEARASWLAFEKVLVENRKMQKFYNLIKKAYSVPTPLAKMFLRDENYKVNFNYVLEKYSSIPDSTINVTDEQLEKYYNDHIKLYERPEETRDLEYVVFDVKPSKDDYKATLKMVEDLIPDFKASNDDVSFVDLNSDVPMDNNWYKQGELPAMLDTFMFTHEKGAIYGPYFENNAYKVSKLSDVRELPDSVHARHILIQPNENLPADKAKALADSLMELLKEGKADFITLAQKYSADKASLVDGGDLGWFDMKKMVQPFTDTVFFANKGDIKEVYTQFGIHIVEVLDQGPKTKKVKVATVVKNVEPGSQTLQYYYSIASKFAGENRTAEAFDKAIEESDTLVKRYASNLKIMDKSIPGLPEARELVKWAFKAEEGEVSDVFDMTDKFVVAKLAAIHPKGPAPLEEVKKEIEVNVIKEIKGDILADKFIKQGTDDINKLAQSMNLQLQNAEDIAFSSFTVPGLGMEFKVIAAATTLPLNKTSVPVIGNQGVFVIKVNKGEEKGVSTLESVKTKWTRDFVYRVDYQAYEAMKKAANIVDERYKFE